jgi:hypothetical protein
MRFSLENSTGRKRGELTDLLLVPLHQSTIRRLVVLDRRMKLGDVRLELDENIRGTCQSLSPFSPSKVRMSAARKNGRN